MAESEFLSSGELGLFTVQNIVYLKRMQKKIVKNDGRRNVATWNVEHFQNLKN